MRSLGLRSVLVCSLALPVGLPARAWASTSVVAPHAMVAAGTVPDAPRTGRVYVDATALGEVGPLLAGEATKRAGACLVTEGVTFTDSPAGPELRIMITPGETTGYSIAYEIVYDGKVVEDGSGASDCQLCTEDELLDRVDAIATEQAPKMVEPAPEVEVVDPDPDPDPDPVQDDEPKPMGGMGKAGIGLLVAGGLSVVAGTVLVIRKPENFPAGDPNADKIETTRPTGGILLGGGVALAVTGAVLLALDIKRRKRAQDDAGPSVAEPSPAQARMRPRLSPWLSPQGAGLGVFGRF